MEGIFITTATGAALEDQISLMDKLTSEWTMRAYVDADRAMRAQAAPAAVAGPGEKWRERWHGSGGASGLEGWSIVSGRALIAYIGRGVSSEAVSAIVMAHNTSAPTAQAAPAHPDDAAVDALAAAMKAKLAKQSANGYGGWDTPECTQQRLSDMLRAHVDKGDPVDVANFCAFLAARGEGIAQAAQGDKL